MAAMSLHRWTTGNCIQRIGRIAGFPIACLCFFILAGSSLPGWGQAQTVDEVNPERLGRLLVRSQAVYLVQDITEDLDASEMLEPWQRAYKVLDTWVGKSTDTLIAPMTDLLYPPGDTLLFFPPENMAELSRQNRYRARLELPFLRLPSGNVFSVRGYNLDEIASLLPVARSADSDNEPVLEYITSKSSPWWQRVGEGMLWQRLMDRWEVADSATIAEDAMQLLMKPVSLELIKASASMVQRYRQPDQWEYMIGYADTVKLTQDSPVTQARFGVVTSWPHLTPYQAAGRALGSVMEDGTLPAFAYIASYAQGNAKYVSSAYPDWIAPGIETYLAHTGQKAQSGDSTNTDIQDSGPDGYLLPSLAQLAVMTSRQQAGELAISILTKITEDRWGIWPSQGNYPEPTRSTEAVAQLVAYGKTDSTVDALEEVLSRLGRDREAVQVGWLPLAILSLGDLQTENAVDTLISWYQEQRGQRYILQTLAESTIPTAQQFIFEQTVSQLDEVLAQGEAATINTIATKPISGSLNILAERSLEIPGMDSLLLHFYQNAPSSLRLYAIEVLYHSPDLETGTMILSVVDSVYCSAQLFSAGAMRMLNPVILAPWLRDKILCPDQPGAPVQAQEALRLLSDISHDSATAALHDIALQGNGFESLYSFATLLHAGYSWKPEELALIIFAPRESWDQRVVNAFATDPALNDIQRKVAAKQGSKIIKKNLCEYTGEQLRDLARTLAVLSPSSSYESIFEVLLKAPAPDVVKWAEYGLMQVKEED